MPWTDLLDFLQPRPCRAVCRHALPCVLEARRVIRHFQLIFSKLILLVQLHPPDVKEELELATPEKAPMHWRLGPCTA
eukprot:6534262-Lingulodinium_polyedra.AAC.1